MRSTDKDLQAAPAVLMVRPAAFAYNVETAASNRFQRQATDDAVEVALRARGEFDRVADAIRRKGIAVYLGEDTASPAKPDACFPNNWVSFHHDGSVVLYPMLARTRRRERRADLIESLANRGGFKVSRVLDLTHWERRGQYLEGTGSMVFDHVSRTAFAALSSRTSAGPLGEFSELLGYRAMTFDSADAGGQPVYHTNVMMSIGPGFALVCLESVCDVGQRTALASKLESAGRQIIPLDLKQMANFVGNALTLRSTTGDLVTILSETARRSLHGHQTSLLEQHSELLPVDIPTIERHGGGSVRCMLAEIFLPPRL